MKSFPKKSIQISLLALALTGCDALDMPHVFGGNEVPPEALAAPRAVETPTPEMLQGTDWKRLGDIPSPPKDFTSQPLINQSMLQMKSERDNADKLKQAADLPPSQP